MKYFKRIAVCLLAAVCLFAYCACSPEDIENAIKEAIEIIKKNTLDAVFSELFPEKVDLTISDVDYEGTKTACDEAGLSVEELDVTSVDFEGWGVTPPESMMFAFPEDLNFDDLDYENEDIMEVVKKAIEKAQFVAVAEYADAEAAQQACEEYKQALQDAITAIANGEDLPEEIQELIKDTPLENIDPEILSRILDKAVNVNVVGNSVVLFTSQSADLVQEP
ncbi:MAG: hypothetical protein PHX51_06080 [Clostridia bacterium]|nr:hypothetical protein [Clostridia bacterium]